MIAIEDAVTAVADLVEKLAVTGGVFDEADLYRALKKKELWKTGYPDKGGEYIVMIEGARKATALEFDLKVYGEKNIWHDEWDTIYKVTHWMEMPEPPEVIHE